jgi:hypothetical protein
MRRTTLALAAVPFLVLAACGPRPDTVEDVVSGYLRADPELWQTVEIDRVDVNPPIGDARFSPPQRPVPE